MIKPRTLRANGGMALCCLLCALLLLAGGCANYRFMRAFEPLLDKDLAIDKEYRTFEESLPNDKHWQENISILKGMIDAKTEILQNLKALTPTKENEDLYNTLIEDLNNSIAYLNAEIRYFQRDTEWAAWQANWIIEGSDRASAPTKKGYSEATAELLRVQTEMTAAAEKSNASQERLARLLQEKDLRRNYQPLKYTRYDKRYPHVKLR